MISFDLDGTLLNPQGQIHPQDIRLLLSEQPFCFIPATGRPLHSTRKTLALAGLFEGQKLPFPLVLQNGAVIYAPGEELLAHFDLPPEPQTELVERLKKAKRVTVLLKEIDTIYPLRVTPFGAERVAEYHFNLCPGVPLKRRPVCNKIMCICEENGPLQEIYESTADLPLERAFSMGSILEFTAQGVNKGFGVKKLVEALGLAGLPFYAAGDGGNDLAILEIADLSFAPLSSPKEIRRRAGKIIDTRENGLLTPLIQALPV